MFQMLSLILTEAFRRLRIQGVVIRGKKRINIPMLFRILILVHFCKAFTLKCPEPAQWHTRARSLCRNSSNYSCLKNDLINGYSENCSIFDFQQPGRKGVLRGGLDADICLSERFQPWPITFYTNVSTNCIFLKSTCYEEGQVIHTYGNRTTDTSCRCDYTRGYDFLVKPRNQCYCTPSTEDCSCYVKTCPESVDKLSPDYECIPVLENITLTTYDCKPLIYKRENTDGKRDMFSFITGKEQMSKKMQSKMIITFVFVGLMLSFWIGIGTDKLCDIYFMKVYFYYEPPSDIELIEGETFEVKYVLSTKKYPISFLKNNKSVQTTKNITTSAAGCLKELKITHVTQTDEGDYSLAVAKTKSRLTKLKVQPMFTSKIEPKKVIEGDQIQLICSVYADDIEVKWYKEQNAIQQCAHISITSNGNQRILHILKATVGDSGIYFVKTEKVEMEIKVKVKALFKRPLTNITIMEGLDATLECETRDESNTVEWFKDDQHIIEDTDRISIDTVEGRFHKLTILKTTCQDFGTYSIRKKDINSEALLDVKEMPVTIKQMSEHEREEFLKAAKAGTAKRYCISVMIVGENSVGKTCLLRRLMNETIENIESTDGINIERRKCHIDLKTGKWDLSICQEDQGLSSEYSEQFADCVFWDFAGQKDFYATHQTFLRANAVYLLVVDISKDFTTKTYENMIEKELDSFGEYIDFWLDNIHCYSIDENNKTSKCNNDVEINPPVIIVGTGIDKVPLNERETRTKNFQAHLSLILSDLEKRKHLREPHFLSNTFPSENKEEFGRLRQDIFQNAQALPNFGDNLPTRWLVLEKELHEKQKDNVITYTDVTELATTCSFPDIGNTTSELDSFLKYEHDIGAIIFFKDMKDFIILDPKWMVDVFRCFVSHQYKTESIGMTEWAVLETTGKLMDNLIVKLLAKVQSLCLEKHKNFVLQIMEKFDIIVKPINDDSKDDFYMPCMIKAMPLHIDFKMSAVETHYCKKTSWFCLEFNFLPPSYFNHILVSFVKSQKLFIDKRDKRLGIYRNIGMFQLNDSGSQILVICLSNNLIAMQVRYLNYSEHDCHSDLKDRLVDIVESMETRYRINITYEIQFRCPEGKFYENKGRVDSKTVLANSEYRCSEHEKMHSSPEIFRCWLTEDEVNSARKNICKQCQYCEKKSVNWCNDCCKSICKACFTSDEHINHSIRHINDEYKRNFTFTLDDERTIVKDIQCLQNGMLAVVIDVDGEQLMTCSLNGEGKKFISLKKHSSRIAVVDTSTIAVLMEKDCKVTVGFVDTQHIKTIVYLKTGKELGIPFFRNFSKNLFYSAIGSEIFVIDISGNVKNCIKLTFIPKDICNDEKSGRIYCIDSVDSKLICIDKDGKSIFTFTDMNMASARSLAIDDKRNIIVLCQGIYRSLYVFKVSFNGTSSKIVISDIEIDGRPHEFRYSPIFPLHYFATICFNNVTKSVVIGYYDTVLNYSKI